MIGVIKDFIEYLAMSPADRYLHSSETIEDLERRMREIDRGKAPFQLYYKV